MYMLAAKTDGATRTKIVCVEYTGTVKLGAWPAAMALLKDGSVNVQKVVFRSLPYREESDDLN